MLCISCCAYNYCHGMNDARAKIITTATATTTATAMHTLIHIHTHKWHDNEFCCVGNNIIYYWIKCDSIEKGPAFKKTTHTNESIRVHCNIEMSGSKKKTTKQKQKLYTQLANLIPHNFSDAAQIMAFYRSIFCAIALGRWETKRNKQ